MELNAGRASPSEVTNNENVSFVYCPDMPGETLNLFDEVDIANNPINPDLRLSPTPLSPPMSPFHAADHIIDFALSPESVSPPSVGAMSNISDNPTSPLGVVPGTMPSPTHGFQLDQFSPSPDAFDALDETIASTSTHATTEVKQELPDLEDCISLEDVLRFIENEPKQEENLFSNTDQDDTKFCGRRSLSQVNTLSNGLVISDSELITITTKELNRKLKSCPLEEAQAIKSRRRTIKNRGYASNCRAKRSQKEAVTGHTMEHLQEQHQHDRDRINNLERENLLLRQALLQGVRGRSASSSSVESQGSLPVSPQ